MLYAASSGISLLWPFSRTCRMIIHARHTSEITSAMIEIDTPAIAGSAILHVSKKLVLMPLYLSVCR